jgi:hypothetical protein
MEAAQPIAARTTFKFSVQLKEETMTLSKQETFDRAVRLAARFDDDFIELGRLLKRLHERDHELFKQVCEKTRLDRRKAYYLVQIARQVEGLPIPRERLARIGWTRMQLVADQLTRENWPQMLELAEQHTAHGLKAVLAGKRPNERCVVLYLRPKDYQRFANAVMKHGARPNGSGLLNKEQALMALIDLAEKAVA